MASSNKVPPSDYDNVRQREMVLQLQNRKYFNYDRYDDNSNGKCGVFGHAQLKKTEPERLRH